MSEKVLAIYQNKQDNSYLKNQIYTITEKFTKEYIDGCAEKYNNNDNCPDFVTLYYDDLLCEMVKAVGSSELFNDCISNLKAICGSIECNINDLESWDDTISELLEEYKAKDIE